jgi:hypothetical protein
MLLFLDKILASDIFCSSPWSPSIPSSNAFCAACFRSLLGLLSRIIMAKLLRTKAVDTCPGPCLGS